MRYFLAERTSILKSVFCGICILFITHPFHLLAKDKIEWLVNDFPPSVIVKGQFKGEGIIDRFVYSLQERLAEYEHTTLIVNGARCWRDVLTILWNTHG